MATGSDVVHRWEGEPGFFFFGLPGKDFDFFLAHPVWQDRVREIVPEVVIVVLGGNSVIGSLSNNQI